MLSHDHANPQTEREFCMFLYNIARLWLHGHNVRVVVRGRSCKNLYIEIYISLNFRGINLYLRIKPAAVP